MRYLALCLGILMLDCGYAGLRDSDEVCVQADQNEDDSEGPPELPEYPPLPEVWVYLRPAGDGPCIKCDKLESDIAKHPTSKRPFQFQYKTEGGCRRYPTIVWRGNEGRVQLTEKWVDTATFLKSYRDSMSATIIIEKLK